MERFWLDLACAHKRRMKQHSCTDSEKWNEKANGIVAYKMGRDIRVEGCTSRQSIEKKQRSTLSLAGHCKCKGKISCKFNRKI